MRVWTSENEAARLGSSETTCDYRWAGSLIDGPPDGLVVVSSSKIRKFAEAIAGVW